jgi:glycosyltransferase involved in cell wall biosynthesis
MDWMPNQEAVKWFLDNCWDEIHKAIPEAKFIIAGRGMPHNLKQLNKPNVDVIENVTNGKLFYQQHQLMVVPLLSGSGLRIKIIEGMSYGKAIVSTSVGSEGINYTNNLNIVIANEANEFSQKVIELLNDKAKQISLQKNATDLAYQQFDNSKVVAELVSFYKKLLNE